MKISSIYENKLTNRHSVCSILPEDSSKAEPHIISRTWGVGRGNEGWGDTGVGVDAADGKDWPSHPAHQPVFDLVPEFEPGKPWKVWIML